MDKYIMRRIKIDGINRKIRVCVLINPNKRLVTAYIEGIQDLLYNYFDSGNELLTLKDQYLCVAKCHELDVFDEDYGVNLAMNRVKVKLLKDIEKKVKNYLDYKKSVIKKWKFVNLNISLQRLSVEGALNE
jgi:hypothetical protein